MEILLASLEDVRSVGDVVRSGELPVTTRKMQELDRYYLGVTYKESEYFSQLETYRDETGCSSNSVDRSHPDLVQHVLVAHRDRCNIANEYVPQMLNSKPWRLLHKTFGRDFFMRMLMPYPGVSFYIEQHQTCYQLLGHEFSAPYQSFKAQRLSTYAGCSEFVPINRTSTACSLAVVQPASSTITNNHGRSRHRKKAQRRKPATLPDHIVKAWTTGILKTTTNRKRKYYNAIRGVVVCYGRQLHRKLRISAMGTNKLFKSVFGISMADLADKDSQTGWIMMDIVAFAPVPQPQGDAAAHLTLQTLTTCWLSAEQASHHVKRLLKALVPDHLLGVRNKLQFISNVQCWLKVINKQDTLPLHTLVTHKIQMARVTWLAHCTRVCRHQSVILHHVIDWLIGLTLCMIRACFYVTETSSSSGGTLVFYPQSVWRSIRVLADRQMIIDCRGVRMNSKQSAGIWASFVGSAPDPAQIRMVSADLVGCFDAIQHDHMKQTLNSIFNGWLSGHAFRVTKWRETSRIAGGGRCRHTYRRRVHIVTPDGRCRSSLMAHGIRPHRVCVPCELFPSKGITLRRPWDHSSVIMSSERVLAIVHQVLDGCAIRLGSQYFRRTRGLSQGDALSVPLCNLLVGSLYHQACVSPDTRLLRHVDDFVFGCRDLQSANEVIQDFIKFVEGCDAFNIKIHDGEDGTSSTVLWCGLRLSSTGVEPDKKRLRLSPSVSVNLSDATVVVRSVLGSIRARLWQVPRNCFHTSSTLGWQLEFERFGRHVLCTVTSRLRALGVCMQDEMVNKLRDQVLTMMWRWRAGRIPKMSDAENVP